MQAQTIQGNASVNSRYENMDSGTREMTAQRPTSMDSLNTCKNHVPQGISETWHCYGERTGQEGRLPSKSGIHSDKRDPVSNKVQGEDQCPRLSPDLHR